MSQWYLSYDGEKHGPYELSRAATYASQRPEGYAWKEGFSSWLPIRQIAELSQVSPAGVPAPPPVSSIRKRADDIDYVIHGAEMQYVEIELDPGESALAEAGSMMYKGASVAMNTVFGDASDEEQGFMSKVMGAGKRVLTGESLFMTVFTHNGADKAHVAFGAPYPGNIIPVKLDEVGGTLICQKDSFLCAAKGVSVGLHFQKKILTALFGGEGFIMQKLEGDGWVFLHAGGSIAEKQLAAGEELHVDTGCIVGYEPSVNFEIEKAGGIKSLFFGGEGFFFARLRGPGKVWLQSLPFSRLAGRLHAAMPQNRSAIPGVGGKSVGEGSILGGLGDLIDGDN